MGLKEANTLVLARRICMFNSEAIYYVKNSLLYMTDSVQKKFNERRDKFYTIVKTSHPHIDPKLIIANTDNNNNHDLTKLDVELIMEVLLEEPPKDESKETINEETYLS